MEMFAFRRLTKLVQPVALIAMAFAFFSVPGISQAAEKEPGKDHPLIGRYEGSVMTFYRPPAYDEAALIKGPIEGKDTAAYLLNLEGNVSFYYYDMPPDRSTLEVFRNYESGLKAKGFEIVFSCSTANGSCKTGSYEFQGVLLNATTRWPRSVNCTTGNSGNARYLLAKHDAGSGTTYASIAICDVDRIRAAVAVVESKEMDTNKMKFTDASEMQKSLHDTGRVNLYGIHFDFDKDEIKPDSQPTIDEMIKFMRANPQIKLQVVGHTDSQGLEPHNLDLSSRRAGSVTRALVQAGIGV